MEKESGSDKRVLLGLFLILAGVIWILFRLDIIPAVWSDVFVSWQMLLIGIGIFLVMAGNNTAGTILIIAGGFFLLPEIFTLPLHFKRLGWPVLIIAIGLALLLTGRKRNQFLAVQKTETGSSNDTFDDVVIFGGRESFVSSKNFHGGKVTAIFGGAEYDMRQANLAESGAVIDCVAIFGGCGFKVPPDWTIINEVNSIFGGVSDKRIVSAPEIVPNASKKLVIKGFTAFGGIEIKYN
jgi:predicted membrane protein